MADWRQVGYTFYNDKPPGAGNLRWGGYSFAELGTATSERCPSGAGVATGHGNLAEAFGLHGEERLGSEWSLYAGHRVVYAQLQDHGYGQLGDGCTSDPRWAVDLYDGSAFGLPNLVAALGASSSGALWIMRGRWHPPLALPPGAAHLQAVGGLVAGPAYHPVISTSNDPRDRSPKIRASGKKMSEHGQHFAGHTIAMRNLRNRHIRLKVR